MTARIKEAARAFDLAALGCAPARRLEEGKRLRAWLAGGYQAGMRWMENPQTREDPTHFAPNARSVLVVGWNCGRIPSNPAAGMGRIANFAVGEDYHRILRRKLKEMAKFLAQLGVSGWRIAVDSAPLLERALARQAGMGWIGKNSCLISPQYGSWLLLGELLIREELEYDSVHPDRCGKCSRCLAACPTGALTAPGMVDSNLCIAYWTVEAKGSIPRAIRPRMGNWIFGCDACQEACPWNRFAVRRGAVGRDSGLAMASAAFLEETDDSFRDRYRNTPFMRTGRAGMARNAAVMLGNSRFPGGLSSLRRGLDDVVPMVRAHAAWALGRYRDLGALKGALLRENDPAVREEIENAIGNARG